MQNNEEEENKDDGVGGGQNGKGGNGAAADADDNDASEDDGETTGRSEQESHQDQGETTATRPDAFQTYSNNDTRMLTLLGLDPHPTDGEEQEDWRQLIGFRGGAEEGHRHNNEVPPRRTRLSFDLHPSAFANMWSQHGELLNNMDHHEPPRQQQQRQGFPGGRQE